MPDKIQCRITLERSILDKLKHLAIDKKCSVGDVVEMLLKEHNAYQERIEMLFPHNFAPSDNIRELYERGKIADRICPKCGALIRQPEVVKHQCFRWDESSVKGLYEFRRGLSAPLPDREQLSPFTEEVDGISDSTEVLPEQSPNPKFEELKKHLQGISAAEWVEEIVSMTDGPGKVEADK